MTDRNNWIRGARIFIMAFIFYESYIKEAFGNYPLILYGTVILATICVAADIVSNKGKMPFLGFPFMLIGYGIYSFITGLFVSRDLTWFYSIMVTHFAFSIVCFDCCYVIKRNDSSEWLLNTFLITAIICSIQTIFFGADYRTEVIVRTMSINNNPNILGLTMIIGIFSLISRKKYVVKHFWTSMAIATVFLYVILLTASRKCLISALALIFIWMYSALRTDKGFNLRKISMIFAILIAIGLGAYYFATKYATSSVYARMLLLSGGLSTRTTMISDAIEYWKTSPIIGIGFCQYQIWSPYKAFSHNSYAEVLCCTGIIGFIIFYTPIINNFVKMVKTTIHKDVKDRYDYSMCLAMLIIELALGFGQIFLYDVSHLLILTYLSVSMANITIESERDQELQKVYGESVMQRRFFKPKLNYFDWARRRDQ